MEGTQLPVKTSNPISKTVKVHCPQCNNFTPATYSQSGALSGVCNHCKATFVRRTRNKETTIKIISP